MHLFPRTTCFFSASLSCIGTAIAFPHLTRSGNTLITAPSPSPTIPASCYTTWDDFEHTTGGVIGPSCYTFTTRAVLPCPACPLPSTPIACPALAVLTTLQVPCSTDCCPTTSTSYLPGTCPTCGECVIPTYTSTITTGCPTSQGYPTLVA